MSPPHSFWENHRGWYYCWRHYWKCTDLLHESANHYLILVTIQAPIMQLLEFQSLIQAECLCCISLTSKHTYCNDKMFINSNKQMPGVVCNQLRQKFLNILTIEKTLPIIHIQVRIHVKTFTDEYYKPVLRSKVKL